jgi:hypothetical protein
MTAIRHREPTSSRVLSTAQLLYLCSSDESDDIDVTCSYLCSLSYIKVTLQDQV